MMDWYQKNIYQMKGTQKMDLQALRFFQAVAKAGSISKAARELNYAQSNLTARIKQLEADLQTQLLYRHNRGTTLTDKGELLLSYTEKIFELINEARTAMLEDHIPNGPLLIGSMESTAAVRLPKLLSSFHQHYPDVDLSVKTGPTEQHVIDVLDYKLDGAFVAGPIDHPELTYANVIEEELVLVTDTLEEPMESVTELENRTILVFRRGCSYRARLEAWLHHEGIIPEKIMEFGTLDGIIGCVSAGLGVTLLPKSVVENHMNNKLIKIHSIPKKFGKVNTVFIYRNHGYMPMSLQKFIEMVSLEVYV